MSPALETLRARFLRDSVERQLGAIASDLLRISNLTQQASVNEKIIDDVLKELKLFTEWAAEGMSLSVQELLADLQREVCKWNFSDSNTDARVVSSRASVWSSKILEASGLIR